MCSAFPVRWWRSCRIALSCQVKVSGVRRAINVGLLENDPPRPGDWVLIHVGFALSKIDEEEARAVLRFLEEIGQAYTDEVDALRQSMIE